MHPHVPVARSFSSLRLLENSRYTFVTPAPKSTHGPALISSSHIVSLFKLHRKFMLVTLRTHAELLARTSLFLRMKINQFYLLLEIIQSRQSSLWMVWTVCPEKCAADV